MPFYRNKPYNELPLLPPNKEFYEDIELYKILALARASLAELKGRSPIIPNPKMLINTLVLQEAIDSSTIQNIVISRDKLFKAFSSKNQNVDPHTKEAFRYREAVWNAFNDLHQKVSIYSYLSESAGLAVAALYALKPTVSMAMSRAIREAMRKDKKPASTLKAKFCNQLFMK